MVDIIKQDMTDIWAVAGDVVAPDSAKVRAGWAVEAVPRQWWNWFENRQDTNVGNQAREQAKTSLRPT